MPDLTEAEALEAYAGILESRETAIEAFLAATPDLSQINLQAWIPGTTMPSYLLPEAKDINPPISPVTFTMTPGGLSYATQESPNVPISVAQAEELIAAEAPNVTPSIVVQEMGGGPAPDLGGRSMTPTPLPGSSPSEYNGTMAVTTTGDVYQGRDQAGWLAFLGTGGAIALGVIRWLIAKVGWQTIVAFAGTALAAKILAMLNDGSPDDTPVMIPGTGVAISGSIVKNWTAGGWPFWMDSSGRIYTKNKAGIVKSWKPKKPIVMVRGSTTLSQFVRAQRYLDKLARTIAKRTKALKLA